MKLCWRMMIFSLGKSPATFLSGGKRNMLCFDDVLWSSDCVRGELKVD